MILNNIIIIPWCIALMLSILMLILFISNKCKIKKFLIAISTLMSYNFLIVLIIPHKINQTICRCIYIQAAIQPFMIVFGRNNIITLIIIAAYMAGTVSLTFIIELITNTFNYDVYIGIAILSILTILSTPQFRHRTAYYSLFIIFMIITNTIQFNRLEYPS